MHIKLFEDYNNKRIIWIHGLPGSGKSTLAKQLNSSGEYVILDDIGSFSVLEKHLRAGDNIILTSPYFENYIDYYYNDTRKKIIEFDYSLEEIWFENDPEACINNVSSRTGHKIENKFVIPEVAYYSKRYKIPPGVETVPVYKKS